MEILDTYNFLAFSYHMNDLNNRVQKQLNASYFFI